MNIPSTFTLPDNNANTALLNFVSNSMNSNLAIQSLNFGSVDLLRQQQLLYEEKCLQRHLLLHGTSSLGDLQSVNNGINIGEKRTNGLHGTLNHATVRRVSCSARGMTSPDHNFQVSMLKLPIN